MGSSMSGVWTCWDFPKFHQPLFFTASFSASPFKLYFVILNPLGSCGYWEQNYVKQTSPFIKNFIFRFCSKEVSGGGVTCIYVLLQKQEKVFLLVGSLEKRNRADPGYLQRVFSKTFHALKGVWSSCLFSLTTQQSTFEFQTRGWLLPFLFQSDHKTLLSTSWSCAWSPVPASPAAAAPILRWAAPASDPA